MKHTTDEAFDRAILNGARFYVNGKEWNPSAEEIAMFERFEQSALAQHEGKPIRLIASEEHQEDFWGGLPDRVQMGLAPARTDWGRVRGYFALFGLSLGILLALGVGVMELVKAVKG